MPERKNVRREMVQADDPRAALRAWRVDRPVSWAVTRFGELPLRSRQFDHLTRTGREVFWDTLEDGFSESRVREALRADQAAVARFRQADPRGAQAVAAYLDLWMWCLARWDSLAESRARERVGDVLAPRRYHRRIAAGSQHSYAQVLRESLSVVDEDLKEDTNDC